MKILKNPFITIMLSVVVSILFVLPDISIAGQNSGSMADVKKETKEALKAIQAYSAEQRDEAIKTAKRVINDLDSDIERLEARIEQKWNEMDKSTRKSAKAALKSMREKRNHLSEWYGGIQHSSSHAWEDVKNGFIESHNTLKKSFFEAAKQF